MKRPTPRYYRRLVLRYTDPDSARFTDGLTYGFERQGDDWVMVQRPARTSYLREWVADVAFAVVVSSVGLAVLAWALGRLTP
jgi:hypothetical protein